MMEKNEMITASVVLYNTPINEIEKLIGSFAPGGDRHLFILDNSPEKEIEYEKLSGYEGVKYIYNNGNLGYGKAHNIGIEMAIADNSQYHVVLNPDVYFDPGVIDELTAFSDSDDRVVYVLPKVVYPDGAIQYLCKLLPTPIDLIFRRFLPEIGPVKRMNERYTLKKWGYNTIINPPCLSGCFMFLRTNTLKKYNLRFDERFFMYCEDFDLIRRLHRYGRTVYYPYVQITHNHARESYKNRKMLMMHIKSAVKYFNKYGWIVDPERKEMNNKILRELSMAKCSIDRADR